MIRVHVICEGQTEERFVNELLYESFILAGVDLRATLIGRPGHKGGNIRFDRLYTDVKARLLADDTAYCTTFVDYYGLHRDFPGKEDAQRQSTVADKQACVVFALGNTIRAKLGDEAARRFIPYVQMHEFEALLFSDPDGLAQGINRIELADAFRQIRHAFGSPEEINDSVRTAPSKRIERLYCEYDKPWHGSLAALAVGLESMKAQCPLFNQWLHRMKTLASP
ncbi:MAG: DUF4276 family protein [Magnetococcales bacterium]|nr:DUF4276 family protein [Magnetococcales bacterium]